MTSTELKIGLTNSARPSSRVLKPPGGGHSNIFAEPEISVNAPRPKYNQQNSTNLNACLGSTDANAAVEKLREEIVNSKQETGTGVDKVAEKSVVGEAGGNEGVEMLSNGTRGRIPPGGHSSGSFW